MAQIEFTIVADENGSLSYIQDSEISFLQDLGAASVKRASHVEPDSYLLRVLFHWLRGKFGETGRISDWTRNWKCLWRVNMSPSNGPILPERWVNRQDALNAEVTWLSENL